jgi:hypothetical protein
MALHGSCLCGSVKFSVDLPFDRFAYCHCSRCRKATGTAHATNAMVKPAAFRWLQGEDLVGRYDLPTAKSFSNAFCRNCGGKLPHATRSGRDVIIPVGSIDDRVDAVPEGHIHWLSRANWDVPDNKLPILE